MASTTSSRDSPPVSGATEHIALTKERRGGVYTPVFESVRGLGTLLAPDGLEWVTELPVGAPRSEYLLHLSCMAHYTPHIPFLAQRILQRLGRSCPTLGGPESCCGTLHEHFGDPDLGRQAAYAGLSGFNRARPGIVVSICPDCDESFNRFKPASLPFAVVNLSQLFVDWLPDLKGQLGPLPRRVVMHRHASNAARERDMENIRTLLTAIPGLELLESEHANGPGSHCNILGPMPAERQAVMIEEAERLNADAVVVPYHSCYRQHCMLELRAPRVGVQHYLDLIAWSMGIPFSERYKELRLLDSLEDAVERLSADAQRIGLDRQTLTAFVKAVIYCY